MAYQVLYRKYRPSTFDEVVGQEYIIKTIRNAIKRKELSHAYLFCGPRGTGKTSLAKLFAKTINCTSNENQPCGECDNCREMVKNTHPDVVELDAASNNSVDDIRNIVESVKYPPIFGKFKVYIIDEVHMLSTNAFNALLKTLEEPPANVIFILATTEPQKIISTVLSRCQRYNFSKIMPEKMKARVIDILNKENINYEDRAVDLIIELSDGGMRDVLSILEQVLAYGNNELKEDDVLQIYGLLRLSDKISLVKKLKTDNPSEVIESTREMYHSGVDINRLSSDLVKIFKEILLYSVSRETKLIKYINSDDVKVLSDLYSIEEINQNIDILIKTIENYKNTADVLSYLEIALLKISTSSKVVNNKKEEHIIEKPKEINKENIITKPEEKVIKKKSSFFDDLDDEEKPKEVIEEITIKEDNEVEKLELKSINLEPIHLLSILVKADRDEKTKDMVIYHKLIDFSFEATKRKFYNILKESEIFASHQDAIIFGCKDSVQAGQINDLENNKEIYFFLKEEFGIDKMVYGIDNDMRNILVDMYRNQANYDLSNEKIIKYQSENKKEDNIETRLEKMFGKITIEE